VSVLVLVVLLKVAETVEDVDRLTPNVVIVAHRNQGEKKLGAALVENAESVMPDFAGAWFLKVLVSTVDRAIR